MSVHPDTQQIANTAQVEFRWQDLETSEYLGKKDHPFEVRLDPDSLFCTSEELDFTLVAIDQSTANNSRYIDAEGTDEDMQSARSIFVIAHRAST